MSALELLGLRSSTNAALDAGQSEAQEQTRRAFGFKWAKRDTYESPAMQAAAKAWLIERYCGGDVSRLDEWLAGSPKIIVDAGCGSGFSGLLLFGERLCDHHYLGIDISDAVNVAAERFRERAIPGDFLQTSLLDAPLPDGSVDIMFSEGVLHHTDSTERSIAYLARKLKPGGRFLFYVYAKKSLIREYTDDAIRAQLATMSDEEAWEALMPLTKLGKALGELKVTIDVPADVPLLGMVKGSFDVQRFLYWNVCKMYYRPELTLDEMNHVNFDWFRPANCHRQTPDEVRAFCARAGLEIERLDVQEAGITVVARRL